MKKSLSLILLFLFMQQLSYSQKVEFLLPQAKPIKIKNGIIICGLEKIGNVTAVKLVLYDNKLSVIKEFSKPIPGTGKYKEITCTKENETITAVIACKGHCPDYYFKFDTDLNEISLSPCSREDRLAFDKERNEKGTEYYINPPFYKPSEFRIDNNFYSGTDWFQVSHNYINGVKMITPYDYPANQLIRFEGNLASYVSNASIRRFKSVPSKYENTYSLKWQTNLDENQLGIGEFIYVDEDICFVIATQYYGRLGKSFIYCLDSKTGKVKNKSEIKPSQENSNFYFTKGFYDVENQKIIVAGNIYNSDYTDRDHFIVENISMFTFDSNCKLISEKKQTISVLPKIDYGPLRKSLEFPIVKSIIKNKDNEYVLQAEIMVRREYFQKDNMIPPYFRWMPIALSAFKLDDSENPVEIGTYIYDIKEFAPTEAAQIYHKYHSSSSDGTKALVSNVYKGKHNVKVITFSNNSSENILASYSANEELDDDCRQYLIDDYTVLVFSRGKGDVCELTLIKI